MSGFDWWLFNVRARTAVLLTQLQWLYFPKWYHHVLRCLLLSPPTLPLTEFILFPWCFHNVKITLLVFPVFSWKFCSCSRKKISFKALFSAISKALFSVFDTVYVALSPVVSFDFFRSMSKNGSLGTLYFGVGEKNFGMEGSANTSWLSLWFCTWLCFTASCLILINLGNLVLEAVVEYFVRN